MKSDKNDIISIDAMMDERYGKVGTPELPSPYGEWLFRILAM